MPQRPPLLDPRLMVWLSPGFPVGAFAYGHGLEWACERGLVRTRGDLESWIETLAQRGSLANDLVLSSEAWRAVSAGDLARLRVANDIALALQASAERHLEAAAQGTAFLATISAAWPVDGLPGICEALGKEAAYPIAVGAVAACHGIACAPTAIAYAVAFAQNLISAAIRLSVIGQTDGQRVLASMMATLLAVAEEAPESSLEDLGGMALFSDLASLAHETQYTRLFRS